MSDILLLDLLDSCTPSYAVCVISPLYTLLVWLRVGLRIAKGEFQPPPCLVEDSPLVITSYELAELHTVRAESMHHTFSVWVTSVE